MTELKDVELSDISSITLDNWEDTLTVEIGLRVGGSQKATYTEKLSFDAKSPSWLTEAALRFAEAVRRMVNERTIEQGELPCDTCLGSCCHEQTGGVRLTHDDVARLDDHYGTDWVEAHVDMYSSPSFTGIVAEMKMVELTGFEDVHKEIASPLVGCINSTRAGCSIYEHRPQVCRDYSPWENCTGDPDSLFTEDPLKVDGKVRLPIVR